MRITYIHQYFSNNRLPGSTRSYEMGRRLVNKGHQVNLITTYRRDDVKTRDWFVTDEDGIRVHWIPIPYSNNLSIAERLRAFIKFALCASLRAARLDTDLVFASSTPLTIAIPGAFSAWRRNVPMIFEVRDLWPDAPIALGALRNPVTRLAARFLESFAYRRAAHIVALSPTMKEGLVNKGIDDEMVTVIPNASDLELFSGEQSNPDELFSRFPKLKNEPFVLYAGALGKVNGIGYMADIARESLRIAPAIKYVVFGEGREKNSILEKATRHGVLGKNFFIYDRITKGEIPAAFNACAVSTSFVIDVKELHANSANKFFDTLAAAKPIVINHEGWQADLIREYDCGLVLPPANPEKAAQMISDLVTNKARLQQTGQNALTLAKEKFDRNILTNQLEKLFVSILGSGE